MPLISNSLAKNIVYIRVKIPSVGQITIFSQACKIFGGLLHLSQENSNFVGIKLMYGSVVAGI